MVIHDTMQPTNKTIKISNTKKVADGDDHVAVPTNTSSFQQLFKENVKYGAQYTFWVKTDVPGSAFAGPVALQTAPIPPPSGLTHNQDYKNKVSSYELVFRELASKLFSS